MKEKTLKIFNSFSAANEENSKQMASISPIENFKNVKNLIEKIYADELEKPMDKKVYFKEKIMKIDNRKYNGGARPGSGPKPIDPKEKKQPVAFQIKAKHVATARKLIQPIVDKINAK